jgi:hypothetical protein
MIHSEIRGEMGRSKEEIKTIKRKIQEIVLIGQFYDLVSVSEVV